MNGLLYREVLLRSYLFRPVKLRLKPEEDRIVSHDTFFQRHPAISQSWQTPLRNNVVFSSAFFSLDFQ